MARYNQLPWKRVEGQDDGPLAVYESIVWTILTDGVFVSYQSSEFGLARPTGALLTFSRHRKTQARIIDFSHIHNPRVNRSNKT